MALMRRHLRSMTLWTTNASWCRPQAAAQPWPSTSSASCRYQRAKDVDGAVHSIVINIQVCDKTHKAWSEGGQQDVLVGRTLGHPRRIRHVQDHDVRVDSSWVRTQRFGEST